MKKIGLIVAAFLMSEIVTLAAPELQRFTYAETSAKEQQSSKHHPLYNDLILQYEQQYGSVYLDYKGMPNGLCFIKLLDFDQDGSEELILIHPDENINSQPVRYLYEIWSDESGEMKQLETGELYGTNGGTQQLFLTKINGAYYLVTGSSDGFEYNYYHGYYEGRFGEVREAIREDNGDSTINGYEVTEEEWVSQEEALKKNMKCYFSNRGTEKDNCIKLYQTTRDSLGIPSESSSDLEATVTVRNGVEAPVSDFVFPYSSSEYLTSDDLSRLKRDTANSMHLISQRAINEILARYGYVFKGGSSDTAQDAYNYFNSKDWYLQIKGNCEYSDPDNLIANMNEVERSNIRAINQWQQEQGVYY